MTTTTCCTQGAVVGRIYKATGTAPEYSWFCGLAYAYFEDRTPIYGYAESREAAMKAFAKSWRRE